MARIASIEEAESIRSQEHINAPDSDVKQQGSVEKSPDSAVSGASRKYIATLDEIREAYDAVNTLRFSQPTHLQGVFCSNSIYLSF